ncbi:MAG: hypothetical protein JWL68_6321, partial [Actinomycetia bacterium]|nr:hypothetical protein [Actinomycetes bacterium]
MGWPVKPEQSALIRILRDQEQVITRAQAMDC